METFKLLHRTTEHIADSDEMPHFATSHVARHPGSSQFGDGLFIGHWTFMM